MAIIDKVKGVCDRLAGRGWRKLLLDVTGDELDISQPSKPKLLAALTSPLTNIDRTRLGFGDFHQSGTQAIAAASPARSLLYHALASPEVHPTSDGSASTVAKDYPTLDELDVIENFIYSFSSDRDDLDDTFIAVFAYQYRVASRTSHLRHADIAYSRTGVARVGTTKHRYDAARRSFWVLPANGNGGVSVLPARYGTFLARRAKPGPAGSVQGGHGGAGDDDFVFPVHKLFNGEECLDGRKLTIAYSEFHRNEKLKKTHLLPVAQGGLPVPPGFDTTKAPYVRDSTNGGNMASLENAGSSVLVVPQPGKNFIRTVAQKNNDSNRRQLVHFVVPRLRTIQRPGSPFPRSTRFATSTLEIPAFGNDRLSPEYVNIRHEVDPAGPVDQTPKDLNTLPAATFANTMRDGGYPAAHYTDDSCDGCLEAIVKGLSSTLENLPAFSLITAPDFFPLADQFEVETDPTIRRVEPLSKGRLPVNPTLPRPSNLASLAFDPDDRTVTAIVGSTAVGPPASIRGRANTMISYLPDSASNVFAPGWDTSRSRDAVGSFLTSSGLGSPFPEDAKLCAALASFWPAVAPDNGRTFGNQGFGNQLPMLDEELGLHPNHERVKSGELASYRGWDGEFGPFFEKVGNKTHVNYVEIARSDYVSRALSGQIRVDLTAEVQSEELIARHQALDACEAVLNLGSNANTCLVVVRKVDNWASFGRGVPELIGAGYLLEFAELSGSQKATSELDRVRHTVRKKHVCQFGSNGIAYKDGGAVFEFISPP